MFREPRKASEISDTLLKYKECIDSCSSASSQLSGAILSCVVGGKMSEGINFNDAYGRYIQMI